MNIEKYFSTRATVRNFSKKEVSDRDIKDILAAAMHAPTTGNMQLYSVILTRDSEKKKQIDACHFNQPAAVSAPVLLTFCADTNRFVRWCEVSDAVPGFDNFQSLLSAVFDATIIAQQFCTIAETQGLGTCYLGTTAYNAPDIARILDLPSRVVPVLTIALGWPEKPAQPSERLPLEAILHNETYRQYSDKDISGLYHEIDTNPANKVFIEENHKQTLAQVFADVRYPRSSNEAFSEIFKDFLASVNFPI